MSQKIAHLQMIQAVIARMASNSFTLKGWSVVLVSALFALSAKDADTSFVHLAYLPAVVFWMLDGFFLHQEKLFRKLYDVVREQAEDAIDFSMDTRSVKGRVPGWLRCTVTKTLLPFHGAIVVGVSVVMCIVTRST